jgi:hypothetical protein
VRFKENYIAHCEKGAVMLVQENGWIDADLAVRYLDHLAKNIPGGVGQDRPKLLILDSHSTHDDQTFRDRCKWKCQLKSTLLQKYCISHL